MLRQNLTLNFSTNKNTTVRINRNFKCCEIFFSDLSRNFNRYFDSEFTESKEYKKIGFIIRSEDSYSHLKSYNKKIAGDFSFFEFNNKKYGEANVVLKKDMLFSLVSSIENNGKDYINNLVFGITIESKFVNLMDFKKERTINNITLSDFTILFKIGEEKDEY
jgi:hypothetical protein